MFVQKCGQTPQCHTFLLSKYRAPVPALLVLWHDGAPSQPVSGENDKQWEKANEELESPASVTFDLWVRVVLIPWHTWSTFTMLIFFRASWVCSSTVALTKCMLLECLRLLFCSFPVLCRERKGFILNSKPPKSPDLQFFYLYFLD